MGGKSSKSGDECPRGTTERRHVMNGMHDLRLEDRSNNAKEIEGDKLNDRSPIESICESKRGGSSVTSKTPIPLKRWGTLQTLALSLASSEKSSDRSRICMTPLTRETIGEADRILQLKRRHSIESCCAKKFKMNPKEKELKQKEKLLEHQSSLCIELGKELLTKRKNVPLEISFDRVQTGYGRVLSSMDHSNDSDERGKTHKFIEKIWVQLMALEDRVTQLQQCFLVQKPRRFRWGIEEFIVHLQAETHDISKIIDLVAKDHNQLEIQTKLLTVYNHMRELIEELLYSQRTLIESDDSYPEGMSQWQKSVQEACHVNVKKGFLCNSSTIEAQNIFNHKNYTGGDIPENELTMEKINHSM